MLMRTARTMALRRRPQTWGGIVTSAANDNGAGATTLTIAYTVARGDSVLVLKVGDYAKDVSGVADTNGRRWERSDPVGTATEDPGFWLGYPTATGGAGATTITVTYSVSRASSAIVSEEFGIPFGDAVDATSDMTPALGAAWDTNNAFGRAQSLVAYAAAASSTGSSRSIAVTTAGFTALSGTGLTSGHHGNTTDGDDIFGCRAVVGQGSRKAAGTCAASTIIGATIVLLKRN